MLPTHGKDYGRFFLRLIALFLLVCQTQSILAANNLPRLTLVHRLDGPDDVRDVQFSQDGRSVAVISRDWFGKPPVTPHLRDRDKVASYLSVWDARTFRRRWTVSLPGGLNAPCFSPDGTQFASMTSVRWKETRSTVEDKSVVTVRDAANGRPIRAIPHPQEYGTGFAYSPDGRLLAVGDSRRGDSSATVSLYRTKDWGRVRTLGGFMWGMTIAIDFSPDGKRAAALTGATETGTGEVAEWDIRSGKRLLWKDSPDDGSLELFSPCSSYRGRH